MAIKKRFIDNEDYFFGAGREEKRIENAPAEPQKETETVAATPESEANKQIVENKYGKQEKAENREMLNKQENVEKEENTDKKEDAEQLEKVEKQYKPEKQEKVKAEKTEKTEKKVEGTKVNFVITKKKKENKSVHKNFLITPSLNEKFQDLAKSLDMTENELFNEMLNNMFQ